MREVSGPRHRVDPSAAIVFADVSFQASRRIATPGQKRSLDLASVSCRSLTQCIPRRAVNEVRFTSATARQKVVWSSLAYVSLLKAIFPTSQERCQQSITSQQGRFALPRP
jgi:hypothetical protein